MDVEDQPETLKSFDPMAVPWTLGDMVKATGLFLAFLVAILAVVLATRHLGVTVSRSAPRQVIVTATFLVQDGSFLLLVWIFGLRKYRCDWTVLGLRPFSGRTGCALAAAALPLAYIFNCLYVGTAQLLGSKPAIPQVVSLFGPGWLGFVLAFALGVLAAPVIEEIVFRGFLYAGLRQRFGVAWGALGSAAIFAVGHLGLEAVVPVLFLGLLFAFLYERTQSLYPGIILHTTVNAIGLSLLYLLQTTGNLSI